MIQLLQKPSDRRPASPSDPNASPNPNYKTGPDPGCQAPKPCKCHPRRWLPHALRVLRAPSWLGPRRAGMGRGTPTQRLTLEPDCSAWVQRPYFLALQPTEPPPPCGGHPHWVITEHLPSGGGGEMSQSGKAQANTGCGTWLGSRGRPRLTAATGPCPSHLSGPRFARLWMRARKSSLPVHGGGQQQLPEPGPA